MKSEVLFQVNDKDLHAVKYLSFILQETITNAETAKEWFLAAAKEVM